MKDNDNLAVVLWTGGKDSALALYESLKTGLELHGLITFIPSEPRFLAHPLSFIKEQASALNMVHECLEIREPFRESYENAIGNIKKWGVGQVVTGDIAEVNGQPNWIAQCSRASGMKVSTPLWAKDRLEILQTLCKNQFKVIISCAKTKWLSSSWVGREIDENAITELCELSKKNGMDICGENGEFHTLVTDAPIFKKRIKIDSFAVRTIESMAYIQIEKMYLSEK
jgi:diphthine-ammonia ligase